jgi:carbon monoxide dehydrogenase subunit G
MTFENSFVVQAPIDDVWTALLDVERVAPCMPGAEVLERVDDDAYKVGIKVKLGPISMLYRGQVEILERDEDARRALMRARAKEARGQGTADAHVRMRLDEQPDGTRATLETEVQLSGRAAAMGQGVIADVSAKLVEEFAANLAEMLEPARVSAAPAEAGAAMLTVEAPAETAVAPRRSAAPSAPAAPPRPAPAQRTLPVGKIAASVIAGRLSNPRTLLIVTLTFAVVFLAIGYAIGKLT